MMYEKRKRIGTHIYSQYTTQRKLLLCTQYCIYLQLVYTRLYSDGNIEKNNPLYRNNNETHILVY